MPNRFDYSQSSQPLFLKFMEFSSALENESSIERSLRDLVNIRVSQLNSCAFCIDMHVKEAKLHGERELRLYHLPIWRDSNLFSDRERAALEWAEVITDLGSGGASDAEYEAVRERLSEREVSDLTFAVMCINGWNRLNAAAQGVPGSMDEVLGLTGAGLI